MGWSPAAAVPTPGAAQSLGEFERSGDFNRLMTRNSSKITRSRRATEQDHRDTKSPDARRTQKESEQSDGNWAYLFDLALIMKVVTIIF
jgi:hypothetical protein